MPDGLHLQEGGHAVNTLAALALKGAGTILLAVGATSDARHMFRGATLRIGEQIIWAAPKINTINVCMAGQVWHQLGATTGQDIDDAGGHVTDGECLGECDGGERRPLARK